MPLERCHAFSFLLCDKNRTCPLYIIQMRSSHSHRFLCTFTFTQMVSTKIKPKQTIECVWNLWHLSRSCIDFLSSFLLEIWPSFHSRVSSKGTCVVQCYRPELVTFVINRSLFLLTHWLAFAFCFRWWSNHHHNTNTTNNTTTTSIFTYKDR